MMYIIAGLGNPGIKFENTRHNLGFMAIDRLAEKYDIPVNRRKFQGLIGEGRIGTDKVVLLKPQTYMNLSGRSIREIVRYYKIPADHLIVIYDDFDLPLGALRIRKNGGPGTHNGMRSVVAETGTTDFPRIRIGTGASGDSAIEFVIGKMNESDRRILDETAAAAADAAADIVQIGIDNAMNRHNSRKKVTHE